MRKISLFNLNGDFINNQNISQSGLVIFKFDKFDKPIGIRMIFDDENSRNDLGKFSSEFMNDFSFYSLPISKKTMSKPRLFPSTISWDIVCGEHVVCSDPLEGYKLNVFDLNGKKIKIIQNEYDPIKVTEKDIDFELERRHLKSKEGILIPDFLPVFRWIYSDDQGNIFVQTWELGPDNHCYYYDVFDPEGRFTIHIPIKGKWLFFKKDKLYSIQHDDNGFAFIKRYKLTWKI